MTRESLKVNSIAAVLTFVALLPVCVSMASQRSRDGIAASAAKFRACRGHRIEGTIGNDVVRLCVTAPQ